MRPVYYCKGSLILLYSVFSTQATYPCIHVDLYRSVPHSNVPRFKRKLRFAHDLSKTAVWKCCQFFIFFWGGGNMLKSRPRTFSNNFVLYKWLVSWLKTPEIPPFIYVFGWDMVHRRGIFLFEPTPLSHTFHGREFIDWLKLNPHKPRTWPRPCR